MALLEEHQDLQKVIVTNIKKGVTDADLRTWFNEKTGYITEGHISEIKIMEKDGKRTNFAFVTFNSTGVVDSTIDKLYQLPDKERQLQENTINLKRAVPKNQMQNESQNHMETTKKLFIANLPKSGFDLEAKLKEIIDPCVECCPLGSVDSYQVIMNKDKSGEKTDEYRGIAFIHLTNEHLADKLAIQFGNGFEIGGRKIDLKKNKATADEFGGGRGGGRGGFGGGFGGGYGGPPRGRGGQRGAPRGGRGGRGAPGGGAGYQQGGYGASGGYGGQYGAGWGGQQADPYAGGYGAYGGQMGGGYGEYGYGQQGAWQGQQSAWQ